MTFVGALALSACATGNSPQDPDGTGPDPPTPGTGTVAAVENSDNIDTADLGSEAATTPLGEPDTAPKTHPPAHGTQLEVTDVRLATHEGFDRVVFDTSGAGSPGWFTGYTENPLAPGSGFPVEFQGSMALEVNISGVTQPADVGDVPGTGGAVTEVLSTITHHGQSHFVIGLNDVLPHSVQVLEEPQRLVIDILHQAEGGVTPIGDPHVEPKSRESGPPHQRVVSDVRLATHEGFDRVVFDTVGEGAAGWFTDYTATPLELGSGLPIPYDGEVALEISLSGMVIRTEEGYEQPDIGTVPGAGGAVNEVISGITHHGQSQFIIAMNDVLPYSIQVVEQPHRVVVDILHG